MTGPEHYKAAENLITYVSNDNGSLQSGDRVTTHLIAAQVHATLALAAASVTPSLSKQWAELIG